MLMLRLRLKQKPLPTFQDQGLCAVQSEHHVQLDPLCCPCHAQIIKA